MNPSVKRLLLEAFPGEVYLSSIYLDAFLMIFVSIMALIVLKGRENGKTHALGPKFTLALTPFLAIISLTSAAFSMDYLVFPLAISILSVLALVAMTFSVREIRTAYILEALSGLVFFLILLAFLGITMEFPIQTPLFILFYASAAFAPVYLLYKFSPVKKLGVLFLFPIFTHLLDASSTFLALQKGLEESQFLAQKFISFIGPEGIFVMKYLIILPVSLYMAKRRDQKFFEEILYLIGIYGLVLGFRNLFLILSAATA